MKPGTRRSFLGRLAALAGTPAGLAEASRRPSIGGATDRQKDALRIRQSVAAAQSLQPVVPQLSNGDETVLPSFIGCYSKGLPHNQLGEVQREGYASLLYALSTGKHADFENIQRGSGMKLVNPQAAFTFQLEGADSHRLGIPPAPALGSAEAAAEQVELYWQALARDIPFEDYAQSEVTRSAARELSRLSGFRGPGASGAVTAANLFCGDVIGGLTGPYISQFLWKPIPMVSTIYEQRYRTPARGIDYMTTWPEWFVSQTGVPPFREPQFDATPRYIYNGRSLAEWAHYDFLYQAFHNAALILLNQGPETILNRNQYLNPANPYKNSFVQTGFATFGPAHICALLGHVTTAALCAAWYQKWSIHRRLRPEAMGARVHQTKTGAASYPIHADLMDSEALKLTYGKNGAYLLPQSYPEGCPLHPSYPGGHATVAGACAAMLKAFFDENGLISDCVVATDEGRKLVPAEGLTLTVGGEINKLAVNIAMGRDFAGIHYRSDAEAGFRLGEEVCIAMLQDMVETLTEDFAGFSFTRLDGTPVLISS